MAVKLIEPFEVKWGDTVLDTATALDVQIASDDLSASCELNYQVLNQLNSYVSSGKATIQGQDYEQWDGNNDYPFTFVANMLGITLITPTPTPTPSGTPLI